MMDQPILCVSTSSQNCSGHHIPRGRSRITASSRHLASHISLKLPYEHVVVGGIVFLLVVSGAETSLLSEMGMGLYLSRGHDTSGTSRRLQIATACRHYISQGIQKDAEKELQFPRRKGNLAKLRGSEMLMRAQGDRKIAEPGMCDYEFLVCPQSHYIQSPVHQIFAR